MIYLDPRAGSGDLLSRLTRPALLQQMLFGDAALIGQGPEGRPVPVGVEVKKVPDLLQCITDKRFVGYQLHGLLDNYEVVYLLVEGGIREGESGALQVRTRNGWAQPPSAARFSYAAVRGWLMTIEQLTGVRVAETWDRESTAAWLCELDRWWSKPWEDHKSHQGMHLKDVAVATHPLADFAATRKMKVAAALVHGIGEEKARALSAAFPSVREMILADPASLRRVTGMGPKLVQRWQDALNERSTQ